MTKQSAFVSLTTNLRRLGRNGSLSELRSYIRKDDFLQNLSIVDRGQRETVLACYSDAHYRCLANLPPAVKGGAAARAKWDAAMIAKLSRAAHRPGATSDTIGREMGISSEAARRAVRRYLEKGK